MASCPLATAMSEWRVGARSGATEFETSPFAMLESFAAWLGRTPLSNYVASQAWVVPTVQTAHILAITVVVAAAVVLSLRVLGFVERGQSVGALAGRFARPSIIAIVILALTGLLMIAGEPTRAIFRYVFWWKMALITLAIALTSGLLAGLKAQGIWHDPQTPIPPLYRVLAGGLLLIWLAIIVAGRWIGYAQGWPGSPA